MTVGQQMNFAENQKAEPKRATLVLAIGFFVVFCAVSYAVLEHRTEFVDQRILMWFRDANDLADPWGPGWFEETVKDLSALGGYPILVLVSTFTVILLLAAKKAAAAVVFVASLVSGSVLSSLLKLLFQRARPDLVDHLDRTFTASFPSAHAMFGTVAWLMVAAMAARFVPDFRLRILVISMSVGVALIIGLTRVYLGVHWPSDIVAGWAMGGAWAGLCWWVAAPYLDGTKSDKESAGQQVPY